MHSRLVWLVGLLAACHRKTTWDVDRRWSPPRVPGGAGHSHDGELVVPGGADGGHVEEFHRRGIDAGEVDVISHLCIRA